MDAHRIPPPGISVHTRAYNSDENGHVVPQRLNHAVGHSLSFLYTRWLIFTSYLSHCSVVVKSYLDQGNLESIKLGVRL